MDEMTLLREARPEVPPVTSRALYAGRARLTEAVRPVVARRRLQRVAVSGLAAVTVVVLVVGLTVAHTISPNGAPPATAAEVLHQAAMAARSQPDPKQGQFHYSKILSRMFVPKTGTWTPAVCSEAWTPVVRWAPDRRTTQEETCGGRLPPEPRKPGTPTRALPAFPGPSTLPDPSTLPADPAALRTRLYSATAGKLWPGWAVFGAETPDDLVFAFVQYLLVTPVRSDLRAALYQTLATIPGVSLKRDATDLAGRRGVALTRDSAPGNERPTHSEILLDRKTYRYLGDSVSYPGGATETARIVDAIVDKRYQRP